jgi:sarcosine oxidase gamma subunit
MAASNSTCLIEHRLQRRVLEFAAYRWPEPQHAKPGWPSAPGALARDSDDSASLLHFAPGRVLAPDPSASTEALLDAAASQGVGTRIDVTGKWERYNVRGPGAARLLACAIELETVLHNRDCVAVTIFDCPAIVARSRDGFDLWALASYAGDFLATAGNYRAVLQRPDYSA